jgi:CheY-like chemotaxis protein
MAETVQEILRGLGHEVRIASTGEEGLRLLRAAPLPDAVVLDVDMPIMSGPTMAHLMLVHDAGEENVPVMLVSSRHDLPEIAGRLGTPYFLQKTGNISPFLDMLSRALRERAAPRSA